MTKAYYVSSIKEFLDKDSEIILGELLTKSDFATTDLQKNAWNEEIKILKQELVRYSCGEIAFEYTVPRIGSRIDVVCIIKGVIFLLEFKVGESVHKKSIDDQVMDYALDLKYFHELSEDRYIVPISVATEASESAVTISSGRLQFSSKDKICNDVLRCNKNTIADAINKGLSSVKLNEISSLVINDWINSRYQPTPTIIEAAQALYRNHTVENISRNGAGVENLTVTTNAINEIIDHCKATDRKAICFVTGVPGAGKTLAGLNIANYRHSFDINEHAVFLSGNGPLVDVLTMALANDKAERENISKKRAKQEVSSFVQNIHKFRDDALSTELAPVERVAIYDEAQRAWDKTQLAKFMKTKKGIPNFDQSEPEFLISVMDRHEDWAVIICLVGGGQEIYKGEAGIEDWFKAMRTNYFNWDIYVSEKVIAAETEYISAQLLEELCAIRPINKVTSLHLGVSLRSFRSAELSSFVKHVIDNNAQEAYNIHSSMKKSYSIYLTRNLNDAKEWVKKVARGTERYGLLASAGAKRLRGEGVWVLQDIEHVNWFLKDKDHVDSSCSLEVVASEFKVQGLEIDYGILAWDIDFRYVNGDFDYFSFAGTSWRHINNEIKQKYLKNAYRVLLTRARQGLVIYVPKGVDKVEDPTRDSTYYDSIYSYLRTCGIRELLLENN